MAEVHSFPLVRADDNLSLHVKVTGLTLTLTPGGWVLTSPTTDHATIAVDFRPSTSSSTPTTRTNKS